jgi:hypothetical protein
MALESKFGTWSFAIGSFLVGCSLIVLGYNTADFISDTPQVYRNIFERYIPFATVGTGAIIAFYPFIDYLEEKF